MSKKFIRTGPKRPIEKTNQVVVIDTIGTSQIEKVLFTSAQAQTFIRMIGNLSWHNATNAGNVGLAIILTRDGQQTSTLAITDGVILYEPEQDVLWGRVFKVTLSDDEERSLDVDIKSMRKLKTGDQLSIITLASAADVLDLIGQLTMFFKQ